MGNYLKHCKKKMERQGERCTLTGRYDSYSLDPVHIIRRSYSQKLKDDPRNIIPGSRFYHTVFDNGRCKTDMGDTYTMKHLLEDHFWRVRAVLHRMRDMDLYYFRRFCRNNRLEYDENDNIVKPKRMNKCK